MNKASEQTNNQQNITTSDTLTLSSAGGETPVGDHPQVQALLQPNPLHHTDDLENQHVLTQIISCLNRAFHFRALEDHFMTQEILFLAIFNCFRWIQPPHLADDADIPGQRVGADKGDSQRSCVGVVDFTGLRRDIFFKGVTSLRHTKEPEVN